MVYFMVMEGYLIKDGPDNEQFEALTRDIQKSFRKQGITKNDLGEAIKWARQKQPLKAGRKCSKMNW